MIGYIIFVIVGGAIAFLIIKSVDDSRRIKQYEEERKKQREIYYNHRNYECKRYDEYLMSPQERLNKIYSELPTKEQQKIVQYAESVYKRQESERYK